MKTMENRLRVTFIAMNFFISILLAGLIFCAFPAPAVSAAELKAELVKKTMEGTTVGFLTGQVLAINSAVSYHPSKNLSYPNHIKDFLRQTNKLPFWQDIAPPVSAKAMPQNVCAL